MKTNDAEAAVPQAIRVPPQPKEPETITGTLVVIFSLGAVALLASLTLMLFL